MKNRRALKFGAATSAALIILAASASAAAQTAPEQSVQAALREIYSEEEGDFRYFLKWFDLDGDGTPEAVVHVVGPMVCGTGGCDTNVLARRGDGAYKLVSTISLTHPLIIASPRRSHGWRDLIVFVAGGGILPGYYAELKFDGRTYPDNPTGPPALKLRGRPQGVVLIKDFKFYTEGRRLPPAPGKSH